VLQVARIPNSIRTLNESEHLLKSGSKVRNAGVLALHALGEELDALFKLCDPALVGCKEMRVLGPSSPLGDALDLGFAERSFALPLLRLAAGAVHALLPGLIGKGVGVGEDMGVRLDVL
jgi:hypothetical protein